MTLLVGFWVPERPASFRNASDAAWWREYLQHAVVADQAWEALLLGTLPVVPPSQTALKLEVLHLHAGGTLRDVDNTAKPVMDAFNTKLYQDDKQVRELVFRSLKFDCEAAHLALQANQLFRAFLRTAVNQAMKGGHLINHLTFVAFRDIEPSLTAGATGEAATALSWNQVRTAFK